ncbi:YlbG family protein [Mechercharimyces sp. CAU 1602]|uniref:YlbG family protein n=1 Tax=Mechercharimyces sp. CAU 1602 TaxID=2973933 RepID=UPI0021611144|nr:YlbG family protein [Mechercharimyces sp. CAU 1602]MCS1350182.1 YlbG family protein [Mechercharimyces sp. CAU 1602]
MKTKERLGLAIWVEDVKPARSLGRLGNIHYISTRLNYVCLYIDGFQSEKTIDSIRKMPFVIKVERSKRQELKTDYDRSFDTPQF